MIDKNSTRSADLAELVGPCEEEAGTDEANPIGGAEGAAYGAAVTAYHLDQLLQHCRTVIIGKTSAGRIFFVGEENDKTGPVSQLVGGWVNLVAQAAALGPEHAGRVKFTHEPNFDLAPLLDVLQCFGVHVCVLAVKDGDCIMVLEPEDYEEEDAE